MLIVAFAKFLINSDVRMPRPMNPTHILAAAELMEQYDDTPMDFADATLVLLAEELGLTEILTLDKRGFSTYRTPTGKRFRLLLS